VNICIETLKRFFHNRKYSDCGREVENSIAVLNEAINQGFIHDGPGYDFESGIPLVLAKVNCSTGGKVIQHNHLVPIQK
jgi:hypothetical protein